MPRGTPYTDEGKPIKARMGRPRKGDLTEAEFWEVAAILAKPRKARGGSLDAAAVRVSQLRAAYDAMSKATRLQRQVSAKWIGDQLRLRGIPGKRGIQEKVRADPLWLSSGAKSEGAYDSGPRIMRDLPPGADQPSNNRAGLLNEQVTPTPEAPELKVESERGGAA